MRVLMKGKLFLMMTVSVFLFGVIQSGCTGEKVGKEYVLTGEVSGTDAKKAILMRRTGEPDFEIEEYAAVEIQDGKFRFSGVIENPPSIFQMRLGGESEESSIYNSILVLGNEQTHVELMSAKGVIPSHELNNPDYKPSPAVTLKVVKGKTHQKYAEFDHEFSSVFPHDTGSDLSKDDYKTLEKKQLQFLKEYVVKNPDHPGVVNALRLMNHFSRDRSASEKVEPLISNRLKSSGLWEHYEISVAWMEKSKKIKVGDSAPDFELETLGGEMMAFSSQLKSNRLIFLDFWASWCAPCRAENPYILSAYNRFSGKGFEVLGVSLDVDKDSWRDAVEEDGMPWPQLVSPDEFMGVADLYGVTSIPTNFLVNEKGVILAKDLRGKALEKKLTELLTD